MQRDRNGKDRGTVRAEEKGDKKKIDGVWYMFSIQKNLYAQAPEVGTMYCHKLVK